MPPSGGDLPEKAPMDADTRVNSEEQLAPEATNGGEGKLFLQWAQHHHIFI